MVGRQDCQPCLRMVWEMHALQCIEHPNMTLHAEYPHGTHAFYQALHIRAAIRQFDLLEVQ